MRVTRKALTGCAIALGVSVAASGVATQAQAWEPKKPVEMIIMAGTGGGADQLVEVLQAFAVLDRAGPVHRLQA